MGATKIEHYSNVLKPIYESLGINIEKILEKLLIDNNIKYHSITSVANTFYHIPVVTTI